MADYPDVITELPLVEGRNLALGVLGDVVKSVDTNKHFRETEAIETELGTNPKGADADVKARLDRIQSEIIAPPVTKIIAGDNITIDPPTGLGDVTITGAAVAAGGAPTFQKVVATDGTGDINCDGTDDQVEINQAITDVSALGGGTVFLRAGIYNISAEIILARNICLMGEGAGTILYRVNTSTHLVVASSLSTPPALIRVSNLSFGGLQTNLRSDIYLSLVTEVFIDHIFCENLRGIGIDVVGGGCRVNVSYCNLRASAYCIRLAGRQGVVSNNIFTGEYVDTIGSLVRTESTGNSISNNYFFFGAQTGAMASILCTQGYQSIIGNVFRDGRNCIVLQSTGNNVAVGNMAYSSTTLITGDVVTDELFGNKFF